MNDIWFAQSILTSDLSSSESSMQPVIAVFSVMMWILTSLFYLLFIIIIVRLIQLVFRDKQRWSISLAVHLLLLVPILARALDMSFFHDGYLTTPFQDQTTAEMIVGSVPGYTFFSTYSLLFCFWIVLYHKAVAMTSLGGKNNDVKSLGMLFGFVNVIIYLIWFVLEVCMACSEGKIRTSLHMAEVFFASGLNIVSAIIFWISGYFVSSRIRNLANSSKVPASGRAGPSSVNNISLPRSNKGLGIAKKIWQLTFIFTSVLALRSVIIIIDWFIPPSNSLAGLVVTFTLRIVFQAACELVPTILTVAVLAKTIVADPAKQPLLREREASF